MHIYRQGAAANHGERSIELKSLSFAWQVGSETLQAKSTEAIRDFATDGRHRYRVRFELEEVASIIEALSASCSEIDNARLKEVVRPRVADLLKLANIASLS